MMVRYVRNAGKDRRKVKFMVFKKAELIRVFRENCACKGIKMTHQRLEIFAEIAATTEHPHVDKIFEGVRSRMPTMTLNTVYRTISLFEKKNIIWSVARVNSRARYDANMSFHPHFICTKCKQILDVAGFHLDPALISSASEAVGEVQAVQLEIRGICRRCLAARIQRRYTAG
jgi:Fur family transcriptional regulator, peroxide stress response regulator